MKILLPAVLLIIPLLPDAKEVEEVEESARDISAAFQLEGVTEQRIVPDGFMKSDLTKGDLNGDGHPDIALITRPETGKRQDDGVSIAGEEEELKQYVAIFTGDKSGKYSLWKFGASHFIESDPNFMNPDGIGALEIKNRVLTISSSVAMSMGGWGAGGCTQKWRMEKSGFRLIGLTVTSMDRKCACGTTVDINLLTGLRIEDTDRDGNGDQMEKSVITRTKKKMAKVHWENFRYDEWCYP